MKNYSYPVPHAVSSLEQKYGFCTRLHKLEIPTTFCTRLR